MALLVPWVIDGAAHSARLFRREHQQKVGEGSGVSRPGDLKVRALNVPGSGFRVAPGAGTAQSRDSAASSLESYGPVNDAEITVTDIPGTGSSGGRRDLVILEITDPEMGSVTYPAPSDPRGTGGWLVGSNFNRITMVYGVGAGVTSLDQITTGPFKNVTGVTLAAINWPANTGTITNAMIEDLRVLQSPKSEPAFVSYALSGSEVEAVVNTSAYPAGGQTWPLQAEVAEKLLLKIPSWATHISVEVTVHGVLFPGGSAAGAFWLRVGANTGVYVSTQDSRWDSDGKSDAHRESFGFADSMAIPESMRGTRQQFRPRATRVSGTDATTARLDRNSSVVLKIMFEQRAV